MSGYEGRHVAPAGLVAETCDRCHVAAAAYAVVTPAGPLTLCGHDYGTHAWAMALLGYPAELLTEVRVPAYTTVYGLPGGPQIHLS